MIIHNATPFAAKFIDELASLHFDNVFNPYADICPIHDKDAAVLIRCRNLQTVLETAIVKGVDSMWIARDLGYRGGRRTGLALTDEFHLPHHAKMFGLPSLLQATHGRAMAERTATIIWKALGLVDRSIFLWNVFPLHPHKPDDPLTNRCHKRFEREACEQLNLSLIQMLRPRNIIAIGRDAHLVLTDLGIEAVRVRHPSYGGQSEFIAEITRYYRVSMNSSKPVH